MEMGPDVDTEELTVRKKSRFKVLKTRLFSRLKRKETGSQMNQSQSSSDVTTQQGGTGDDDSEDDSHYPHRTLSSRALSHDSIFLANQAQSSECERVLSQENVHSKIKALQLKLQQQNMRLGPPPLRIPTKRIEDSGTTSEDDGLPCSPPEISLQDAAAHRTSYRFPDGEKHLSSLSLTGTGSEEEEQPLSRPLSPVSRLSPQAFISSPTDLTSSSSGVDFSSPAQYVPILDNSAARHRMSIKPRNQRASTKVKQPSAAAYHPQSKSVDNLDQLLLEKGGASQSMISMDTVNLHLYSTRVTSSAEELISVSLPTSIFLQDQPERAMALDRDPVDPPRMDSETLKPAGRFQAEGRIRTNPLFLQPMSGLYAHLSADIQCTKDTAADFNEVYKPSPVKLLATDYYVTSERSSDGIEAGATEHLQTLEKAADRDVLKPAELIVRAHPVPAPRTMKPTLENRNTSSVKISNTKYREVENEPVPELNCRSTVPFGDEDDEPQRLNSFRFSIASARNRSRVSGERVAKKEDVDSSDEAPPNVPSYNQHLEAQMEKTHTDKPIEVNRNTFATSSLREVILQNVSKTEVKRSSEWGEGCSQSTEPERSKKVEECEDKKNLFGVKLRTTSLSLQYRSDVAKSKTKRHSLEDPHIVSEGHTGKEPSSMDTTDITNDGKSNVLASLELQSPGLQQDPTSDKVSDSELPPRPVIGSSREADTTPEPAWMTLVREKTRAHKPSTEPCSQAASPLPSTSTPSPRSPIAPLPLRTVPHHRPLPLSTKPQLKTPLNTEPLPTPPTPAARAAADRQASNILRPESHNGNQLAKGVDQVEIKGPPKPGVKSNTQQESDVFRRTPTFNSFRHSSAILDGTGQEEIFGLE
ncbi:uncharacterized protein cracdlb isoform X2 [Brachyhypopomus gauderio]|uniref:uncharacterized protein cracdlb isoform X2 n=1 Tax=Brachyhypopomus gauderio TaxID=698409 RepID=UPI00404163C0